MVLMAGLFGGRFLSQASQHNDPLDQQQRTLSEQLASFRGANGLFVNSLEAAKEPGLYQSAYGLSALRAAGDPVPVSLSGQQLRKQLALWIEKDPLWGRYYFALLEQATGKAIHTNKDVQALEGMLTREGYFRDPEPQSPQHPTAPLKLSQTVAALEALEQFGSPLTDGEAQQTMAWLRDFTTPDKPQMVVEYNIARAFELLGEPAPKAAKVRVESWVPGSIASSAEERSTQLTDTAAYVLAADIMKVDLSPHRDQLEELLKPQQGDLADPQMGWMVARALSALTSRKAASDAVSSSVRVHLLENGLVSKVQSLQGTLSASYQAERLRMATGLPVEDEDLRYGLERTRAEILDRGTALDRATWLVTYRMAGGKLPTGEEEPLREAVRETFPRKVTKENVQAWSHYVDVLQLLEEPVPTFTVKQWEARDAESRSARNLLVFNLERLDRLDQLKDRPAPKDLINEASSQLRVGTVTAASLAVDAASSVGWVTDQATSQRLAKQVADRTGCSEGSLLVREADDTECSISATLAAARLSNLLEVPGGGEPEPEDRA